MIWSFVYVIGHATSGPVKIGFSTSPMTRLNALQTSTPRKLSLLASAAGGIEEESFAHKYFSGVRKQGEWFRRSAEIKKFIDYLNGGMGIKLAIERINNPPRNPKLAECPKVTPEELTARFRQKYEWAKNITFVAGESGVIEAHYPIG